MKYEIDTIPVWDAVKEAAGKAVCPLCLLEKKATLSALRYFLSDAVMVPEVRVQMNEKGFSRDNWRLLLQDGRRLPLALAAETRWKTFRERIQKNLDQTRKEAEKLESQKGPQALFASKESLSRAVGALDEAVRRQQSSCLVEERVRDSMGRYIFTLVQLPFKDPDFHQALRNVTLCPAHLVACAKMALDTLDALKAAQIIKILSMSSEEGWQRAQEDVYQFTQKFDSRSGGDFTGLSDAPEKVVALLAGWIKIREKNEERRR